MARAYKHVPKRLGAKLAKIRQSLGDITFEEMVSRLDLREIPLYRSTIYEFEAGRRVPPLIVLLRYAKLAGISTDDLIDDNVNLPERLPMR
jgi:transcriptional regulator with XRE-family HTH domain